MSNAFMTFREVSEEQKKPLDYKIEKAVETLKQAFSLSKSAVAVAFSGGKDSTVLWHLIRTYLPEARYYVIFSNTTVEFPESLKFARELGEKWSSDKVTFVETLPERLDEDGLKYEAQVETLKWLIDRGGVDEVLKADGKLKSTRTLERTATPEMWEDFRRRGLVWKAGTLKSYWWCVDQYGYPILGKSVSKLTARRINIDCFLRFSETGTQKAEVREYYELLRHVKTSNHCCAILKKEPSEKKQAELGIDVIIKGLMASESRMRLTNFATRGYIFKSHRPHAPEFYHVSPLGIWTDDDIWEYIRRFSVPYSPLYDIEYVNSNWERCTIKRNGCVGCCTDIAFRDNHFSVLRKTHPKLWEFYMNRGMAEQLMALENYKSNDTGSFLDIAFTPEEALERRPCAFDDIGEHINRDDITDAEYDSEQLSFDDIGGETMMLNYVRGEKENREG